MGRFDVPVIEAVFVKVSQRVRDWDQNGCCSLKVDLIAQYAPKAFPFYQLCDEIGRTAVFSETGNCCNGRMTKGDGTLRSLFETFRESGAVGIGEVFRGNEAEGKFLTGFGVFGTINTRHPLIVDEGGELVLIDDSSAQVFHLSVQKPLLSCAFFL